MPVPTFRATATTRLRPQHVATAVLVGALLMTVGSPMPVAASLGRPFAGVVPNSTTGDSERTITFDGVVRTVMRDGTIASNEGQELLVAEVQGVLLPLDPTWTDSLADRQPVTVSIELPQGLADADALASAAGLVPGSAARVISVVASGPAPTIRALDRPDGTHTVTVLPVYWAEGDPWLATVPTLVEDLADSLTVWSAVSADRVRIDVTAREAVRIGGAPTCDPLLSYNAALLAHGMTGPDDPLEHVAIVFPRGGLTCPLDSAAMLGGGQLWPRTDAGHTDAAHGFGHNLGLGHVGTSYCPGTDDPLTISTGPGCSHHDGNEFEIMGQPALGTELNPAFAELLGWTDPPVIPTDVVSEVALTPVRQGDGTHAVKIPLSDGRFAYARTHYPPDVLVGRIRWVGNAPRFEDTGRIQPGPPMFLEGSDLALSANGYFDARLVTTPRGLDTTAPPAPTITEPQDGVILPSSRSSVALSWTPGDDGSDLIGYRVYRNGEIYARVRSTTTSFPYLTLPYNSQRAVIVVEAVDSSGNAATSSPVVVWREGPPPAAIELEVVTGYASAHATWQTVETHPPLTSQSVSISPTPSGWTASPYPLGPDARSFERRAWAPGHYTLTVRGSNGHYPDSYASVTFDVAPPTLTASATTPDGHAPVTVSWVLGETPASPPASFRIDVDGVPRATAPGDARSTVVRTAPGEHQITVTAIDPWGDTVTSGVVSASVAPDEPTHTVTVDGTIRTLVQDGSPARPAELIVDVGGVLLHVPDGERADVSDGQPVSVAIVAPVSMTGDQAALAAGLPGGGPVAQVVSVTATGAPGDVSVPADGTHRVTVLPVAWQAQPVGTDRTAVSAEYARSTWNAASGGHLSVSPSTRALARLTGPTTCDPLAQYNAALVAHGIPPATTLGARDHVVVHIAHSCGWQSLSVLGGRQMWTSWTDRSDDGSWIHAFGHNLGLGHASVGGCAPGGVPETPSVSCWTSVPGYDWGEAMSGGDFTWVSGAMAERLGWLTGWQPSPLGEVTGELREGGPGSTERPLVIPLADGRTLVVEAGQASGIEIRVVDTRDGSVSTQRLPAPSGAANLVPGEVYAVPGTPYVVSALSANPSGAPRVRVMPGSADVTPPTAPLITSPTTWAVTPETTVTWEPASDTDSVVAGYRVHVDGVLAAIVPPDRTSATVPVPSQSAGVITVTSVDGAGNAASSTVTAAVGRLPHTRLGLTQGDGTTISATWSVGTGSGLPYVPVTRYTVEVVPGSVRIDLGPEARDLEIPDLDPHTLYYVTLVTHTPAGDLRDTEMLRLTAPDSWLSITSPAPFETIGSPFAVSWDIGPGLEPYVTYCSLVVDDHVVRYVSRSTREVHLAADADWYDLQVRCFLANGTLAAATAVTVTVYGEDVRPPFRDVASTHPFSSQITWMFNRGITTGYSDGTYRPGGTINRDAMAAFLFRYAGADIEGYEAPATPRFSDVPTTHPFYREISWMAETGISTGYPDGTFRPNAPVSRDAMAAFLYRFAGGPAPADPRPTSFTDVPTSHPFHEQITWLAAAGITTGFPGGTYRPGQPIARDAMAAFLSRMDAQWPRSPFQSVTPRAGAALTAV